MNRSIIFCKTLEYDPTYNGQLSLYDGFVKSTQRLTDPQLKRVATNRPLVHVKVCFASEAMRTKQTAKLLFAADAYEELSSLTEVRFDLSKLVSKQEFDKNGSDIVRQRFVENFIADTLDEKRSSIFRRIDGVFEGITATQGSVACVSHSFFMKVLEADIGSRHKLRANPDILKDYINSTQETYLYGTGLTLIENRGVYAFAPHSSAKLRYNGSQHD